MFAKNLKILILSVCLMANWVFGDDNKNKVDSPEIIETKSQSDEIVETRGVSRSKKSSRNKILTSAFLGGGVMTLAALGYLFYPQSQSQPALRSEGNGPIKTFNVIFHNANGLDEIKQVVENCPSKFVIYVNAVGDTKTDLHICFKIGDGDAVQCNSKNARAPYFSKDEFGQIVATLPQDVDKVFVFIDKNFNTKPVCCDWDSGINNFYRVLSGWFEGIKRNMNCFVIHDIEGCPAFECSFLTERVKHFNSVFCLYNVKQNFTISGHCTHKPEIPPPSIDLVALFQNTQKNKPFHNKGSL